MSDARRYAVWPEPRSRSRSLKGSRPSVPHGTNFLYSLTNSAKLKCDEYPSAENETRLFKSRLNTVQKASSANTDAASCVVYY